MLYMELAVRRSGSGELYYDLPREAIAQEPAEPRDLARLLVCKGEEMHTNWRVRDLPELLSPGDVLVFNATRTRQARVVARRPTGGRVELLFLRRMGSGGEVPEGATGRPGEWGPDEAIQAWEVLAKPSRKLEVEMELRPEEGGDCCAVRVEERLGEGYWSVKVLAGDHPDEQFFERHGHLPLPPYFKGSLESEERYQTIFGDRVGSAASPTAGLHFTSELLWRLEAKGIKTAFVYLEIGADTLRPIRRGEGEARVRSERCEVGPGAARAVEEARVKGGRVVAVGTTVVRTLESFARPGGRIETGSKTTKLFVEPGFRFQVVDALMTNFHAPNTSMLHMLAAFYPRWREAYKTALKEGFRFLSFGDAMLVLPQ